MDEEVFLSSLRHDPGDEVTWSALADWLDDAGECGRAELVRIGRKIRTLSFAEGEALRARAWGLLDAGARPVRLERENSVGMRFAWVEAGSFLMGSPPDEAERSEDETQHEVRLTRGFWLGMHPVTQVQYEAVIGINPSHFEGPSRPVEQVSWEDAVGFCRRLSEMAAEEGERRLYRLPTEAEWEYSCRGGAVFFSPLPFHFREPTGSLSAAQANFDGNSPYCGVPEGVYRRQTTDVGAFEPNSLGVHDMHGNVWECCADWYDEYDLNDPDDPQGPQEGELRMLRGGSWLNGGLDCRAAVRFHNTPDGCGYIDGFRAVCSFSKI